MKFTGERMIPKENKGSVVWAEHYARYIFSSQFVQNKIVLDIACGSGFGSFYTSNKGAKKVFGIDIAKEAIKYAERKFSSNNIEYKVGACEEIPLPNGSVDVVISFETIEHVKDYNKFLSEIKRVSRPNALVILSTPNSRVYPKGNHFHLKEFDYKEIDSLLKSQFENVKFFYQHNWLSSAVLDEKSIRKEDFNESLSNSNTLKIISDNPKKSLYFIALASNEKLPKTISFPIELYSAFIDFNEKLISLSHEIEDLKLKVKGKNEELSNIYNSRSWKITTKLKKVKKSLPIVKKL